MFDQTIGASATVTQMATTLRNPHTSIAISSTVVWWRIDLRMRQPELFFDVREAA
jgi:hypothetical protein